LDFLAFLKEVLNLYCAEFFLVDDLPLDVDFTAIIFMESLGLLSFLEAILFFRQFRRIRAKQRAFLNALNRRLISERGDGKCHSSEWVLDNIVFKPKKILVATPLLITFFTFMFAAFFYGVAPSIIANVVGFGYASVVALVGIAILLWTDAFEAYGYTNAISKVATENLDREDQSYIELAREALEKASLRFASLGVAFAVFGPFIPQIFSGVVSVLVVYSTFFFQASEESFKIFASLGALVVMILSGLVIFLPELLGKIIIRKGKSFARWIFKRKIEK
jgi:hypothetical protein